MPKQMVTGWPEIRGAVSLRGLKAGERFFPERAGRIPAPQHVRSPGAYPSTGPRGLNCMNQREFQRTWGQVLARAWGDVSFKARLLNAPESVFQEYGLAVPPHLVIRVKENGDRMIHLRCYRRGTPEWYVECTSSCYFGSASGAPVQVWSRWQLGWTTGVAIP
jgi:hypothetical protein